MQVFIVYGTALGLFFAVFPIYFSVYTYANTEIKYASANFCLFRFIRFLNVNTVEDGIKMQINGKDAKFNAGKVLKYSKIFLDNICIFKIVQLGDYGLKKDANAYVMLAQSALTLPLYKYLDHTKCKCKLRNYIILNVEDSHLRYCSKAVCVINMLAVTKILFIILLERFK